MRRAQAFFRWIVLLWGCYVLNFTPLKSLQLHTCQGDKRPARDLVSPPCPTVSQEKASFYPENRATGGGGVVEREAVRISYGGLSGCITGPQGGDGRITVRLSSAGRNTHYESDNDARCNPLITLN